MSFAILTVGNGFGGSEATSGKASLTATAEGFGGEVSVTVTMDGDKITNVDVVGAGETAGIGTNAIEQLPSKIVEANSTDVEVVAGATVTSEAIIEAVNAALATQGGGAATLTGVAEGFGGEVSVTVTMDGDKITNVEAVGAGETAGIGTNALEQLPSKIVEANSTDVEAVAGATVTSEAIIEAVNNALATK